MDVEIEQLKTGDRTAWNRAFEILYAISLSVCCSQAPTLNHQEQEDVAIEAIGKLGEIIEEVDSFEGCKKLVVTISKNRLLDHFRHLSAQKRAGNLTESLEQKEGFDPKDESQLQPDALVLLGENALILAEALKKVPEQYRKVVEGFYLKGSTQQEIADRHGLKIGSIGVYLDRGLKALRENLPEGWP
ncbi:MAG: RNA polymerase sigma factor [Limisphaerales bacterium]